MSQITQPKISIITVVYNGAASLEKTIQSVLHQTYPNWEYIIIDGGSKDGTQDIIRRYEQHLAFWVSERDRGLYDAMNKGLLAAKGDFVWFVNSGDRIFAPETLASIISHWQPDVDILFGEVMMENEQGTTLGTRSEITTQKLPKQLTWQSMKYGMVVSHQAFMPKRSLSPLYIEKNLCADIEWVIACLKNSKKTQATALIWASFQTGGISRQRHKQSLRDRYVILQKHFGIIPNFFHHLFVLLRAGLFRLFRLGKHSYFLLIF